MKIGGRKSMKLVKFSRICGVVEMWNEELLAKQSFVNINIVLLDKVK
jgi:hypothetical protein